VVVVVVDPPLATAMTGLAFPSEGGPLTIPVATLLFGYGVQVRLRSLPDTTNVKEIAWSTVRVIAPPEAVKGPTVPGVEGRTKERPVDGTGLGIRALIAMGGAASVAGVAPVASTLIVALPAMAEFPSAAAAETMLLGRTTVDWKLVKLNVEPDAGAMGEMVPVVTTPLSAMLPTGVPGQNSS
jgi:hypothetical protein